MTQKELARIDEAIQKYGDGFWNDPNDDDGEGPNPNRGWIVLDLLDILKKDGLDLKIV